MPGVFSSQENDFEAYFKIHKIWNTNTKYYIVDEMKLSNHNEHPDCEGLLGTGVARGTCT